MANKENLPPSPGFAVVVNRGLSPSSKPILSRQRDHSTCRRPETPLKVRKTRENLKDCYSIPLPPCSHNDSTCHSAIHATLDARGQDNQEFERASATLPGYAAADNSHPLLPPPPPPLPPLPPQPQRMQRHKSVSDRMLSIVKQGIRNRSQSILGIRAAESETSLLRRLSSKRKQSSEAERRAQSFEICRDSIDGTVGTYVRNGHHVVAPARSFTDLTVSTAEVFADSPSVAPSAADTYIGLEKQIVLSSPLVPIPSSPAPTPQSLSKELLARLFEKETPDIRFAYVELGVSVDLPTIDAGSESDVWVAINATVRSKSIMPFDSMMSEMGPRASLRQLGTISNLRLYLKPLPACRIEEIVGQRAVKELALGQTCSLFIKVHVLPVLPSEPTGDTDQASLFTELESTLGTLETELLHVEARYRHSLLPFDSVVTLRQAAKVRRPKSESRWSLVEPHTGLEASAAIHNELASHIASQYAPERALRLLDRFLGVNDNIRGIREALRETIHQQEALFADANPNKPAVIVTDIDVETSPSTSAAPLSASQTFTALGASSLTEPEDDARKLWRHIRRHSLSAKQLAQLSPDKLQHLEDDDDALKNMRQQAIANKRSVGAETLRAWKWEEKAGHNSVAPWL